jgi:hypothetical protein
VAFTSQLGGALSQPGHIVLGGGIYIPIRIVTFPQATLSFSGSVTSNLMGRLIFSGATTIIAQLRQLVKVQERALAPLQVRFRALKVVQRTTTQLDTVPKFIDMAITETYPYQVDVTNYLASGDTISSIVAILTLLSTSAVITTGWQGSTSTQGNIIQVPVIGSALQLNQSYQLAVTFTAATGKRLTFLSQINVVA